MASAKKGRSRPNNPRKLFEQTASQRSLTIRRISQTEWEYDEIAEALQQGDQGNFWHLGQLVDAVKGDGTIKGQIEGRYGGLLALPRYDEADRDEVASALTEDFDTLAPASELTQLAADGELAGFGIAELVEDRPQHWTIQHHSAQYARYIENEDQWVLNTKENPQLKINPGDGRWILYRPMGKYLPHRNAMWRALARNYILKENALLSLNAWNGSLATPAKVLEAAKGGSEEQQAYAIQQVDNWGFLPSYLLPEGWKLSLLQADQKSAETFEKMVEICNADSIFTISGTRGLAEQGSGFGNTNVFASVVATRVQSTGNALAQCLNEQLLPVWEDLKFGTDSRLRIRFDTTPPRDLKAIAEAVNMMGSGLKAWSEAWADPSSPVDLRALAEQFGIPLLKDHPRLRSK